jgi:hypothetical protein
MNDTPTRNGEAGGNRDVPPPPPWARATLADLVDFHFESPVEKSDSADSATLSALFGAATGGELPDTPTARLFHMLAAATGMTFRAG